MYQTLHRFVGWAMTQRDRRNLPIMPGTVHRYMEGTKKFLRFHGIQISNEKFEAQVTMPVAEEIPDIAIDRKTIRQILMCGMPLWTRVGCAIMKDAGTRMARLCRFASATCTWTKTLFESAFGRKRPRRRDTGE